MSNEPVAASTSAPRSRLMVRGESAVASIGIALAAILLCTLAASAWWTTRVDHEQSIASNITAAQTSARLLAQAAESMLADGEASSVRRLIASQSTLARLRILLPDGAVIADREASRIKLRELPEQWPGKAAIAEITHSLSGNTVEVRYPMHVPGRGAAELQLGWEIANVSNWVMERLLGLGVIAVAALAALLLVYRNSRERLRAMGAIRESLLAIEKGEHAPSALTVSADLGVEAAAWNEIVGETEKLRKSVVMERARESLDRRRNPRGELDEACDAMPQGIILLDEKLRAKYLNGAAGVFLQTADRNKAVGAELRSLVRDEEVKALLGKWEADKGRRRLTAEVKSAETGGVLRWSIRPVRREDGGFAMISIEDITQQRVAEEARHAFVAQATHELRTPLTNIRLYIETAIDDGENDAALRSKCLNVINTETRRLERIVSDLLSTAQIEAGSLKLNRDDVRLDEVFADIQADYEAQAKDKGLALIFNLPPKLPVVQGDRDMVMLALHNLIGNALKYTPVGGSVSVNVDASDKRLTVDVVDTGIGISVDDQQRLFEKFYRAQDRRIATITGSGLGLALAREVVRLHGGDITVQSEVDKGSTFTMVMPTTAEAA